MAGAARVRPVYLSASYRGMQAERDHLTTVVFPALRKYFASNAIEPVLVDPTVGMPSECDAESPDRLADRLRELERCRPFFIALFGGPSGPPVDPIPPEVLAEHPWLGVTGLAGLSLRQIEVHCWLRTALPGQGLFYVRRPGFLATVSARDLGNLIETNPVCAQSENDLLRELEQRRFTVREYDVGWDSADHLITDLDAFGEQIFQDLCAAFEDDLAREQADADTLPQLDENVQFTVYRPKVVEPRKWYPLLAFAHLSERPPDAPPDEPDPIEEVQRQAEQVFGTQAVQYQDVTQDSRQAVPRAGELTFLPEVPGVEFNPPRRTFRWLESVQREEFRLRAAPELDGKTARGRLSVFLGAILLADVNLSFRVDSRHASSEAKPPLDRAEARPYRNIFASYSHADLDIVRQFERLAEAFGDRYVRDWTHLRTGQVWNDQLMRMIDEADVFQLFWSRNAMTSPFVRQEWEHALSLDRAHFVRPTYWEDPLPTAPEQDLPPERLRRLHFQRISAVPVSAAVESEHPLPSPPPVEGPAPRPLPERINPESLPGPSKLPRIRSPLADANATPNYEELKQSIHRKLVDKLDLSRVSDLSVDTLLRETRMVVERLCELEDPLLKRTERERLIDEVLDETFGLGPLEALLNDPTVGEIFVNGPRQVFIKRRGRLEVSDVKFRDSDHLLQIIDRIVSKAGLRADETTPIAEARLPDGTRISVAVPPIAVDGPSLTIRRPGVGSFMLEDLLEHKTLTPEVALFLEGAVKGGLNILVCGPAGAGKTTLLGVLCGFIPENERVVVIEDAAELRFDRLHLVRLQTRLADLEGKGELTSRDLVRHALGMRPDRLIVGEIHGPESADLCLALAAGRVSALTSLAAFSPADALARVEALALGGNPAATAAAGRSQLGLAWDLIVQVARPFDGSVRIIAVSEHSPATGAEILVQDIFRFETDPSDGPTQGRIRATGTRPRCLDRLAAAGIRLPADLFKDSTESEPGERRRAPLR